MSRSLESKKRKIEKKLTGGNEKERKKTRGQHGCARLKAMPRSDVVKPIEAVRDDKITKPISSKGNILGKIKFKLFGK